MKPFPAQGGLVGVLLLNLGGPNTLRDVEPFLFNLFSDPDIVPLPPRLSFLNDPIARVVACVRGPQSREKYAVAFERWDAMRPIGFPSGPPQLATSQAQGKAIVAALQERGIRAKSYVATRYWTPSTSDALADVMSDGVDRLVILPLYPHYSEGLTGSSLREVERVMHLDPSFKDLPTTIVPTWYDRKECVQTLARQIASVCDTHEDSNEPHILFTAHSVPKRYIAMGDPYQTQVERHVSLLMKRMREMGYSNDQTLAYQSKIGPIEWLAPCTDDVIRHLATHGVRSLVVVPVSFVSEHVETLEEIDCEYKEVATASGITSWSRVPALGLEPAFVEDLANAIVNVFLDS